MKKISKEMGNRFDRHQLRDRWHGQTRHKHVRKTGVWDNEEDNRLMQVIKKPIGKYSDMAVANLECLLFLGSGSVWREMAFNLISCPHANTSAMPGEVF
jgi:hypothetical protein